MVGVRRSSVMSLITPIVRELPMSNFATEPLIDNAWYIAAWPHEIADGPLARRILGEDLVLFRDGDGKAAAMEDRCPHRGVRLSLGTCIDKGLQCGYHGLVFNGDGKCVDNPGEAIRPGVFDIRAFKVIEKQKFLWIWMGDQDQADEDLIIEYPFHDEGPEWDFHYGYYPIAANYMFMMDNLMDLTHLGYVHTSTIGGNPEEHNDADLETKKTDTGAHFIRWMMNSTPPVSFVKAGGFDGKVDRWSDFEYVVPASVLQWGGAMDVGANAREDRNQPGGLSLRLFHHATPETDDRFHYFFSAAVRGHPTDTPASQGFYEAILEAFLEDKTFIESQQDAVTRDPGRQLHFREHDKAVAYSRRAIAKLAKTQMRAEMAAAAE